MKRILTGIISIIMIAALCSGCTDGTADLSSVSEDSEPAKSSTEPASADSSLAEQIPVPEDRELAAVLQFMRDAEPDEVTVEWITSDDGAEIKLRITSELFAVIADVLATEPYTAVEEFPDAYHPKESLNVNFPVTGLPDERSSMTLSLNTMEDNPENDEFAGKMAIHYSAVLSDRYVGYSYPMSTYEKLTEALQAFVNTEPVVLDGSYVPIKSGFLKEAGEGDFRVLEALQFDKTLILLWFDTGSGPNSHYAVEAVDAVTGKSLYHFAFEAEFPNLPHIEKTDAAPYGYRINYRDRIEYRNSTDKDLLKTVVLPNSVAQSVWDSSDFYMPPFDVDMKAGLLAYGGADGIYLCGVDGENNRQILSNSDIPAIISGQETPEHEDSQLKYAMPLLMNGGKQLVASIYLMTNGNYDTLPVGVTIVDLDTGEKQSRADIAWLASVQRLTLKTVGYVGGGDVDIGSPGFVIWDAETKQTRGADFKWHESYSYDFTTFVQADEGRGESGETRYRLYSYTLENPDNKTTLLTVQNGWLRLGSVTESYAICYYDDGLRYSGTSGNVIVPYN